MNYRLQLSPIAGIHESEVDSPRHDSRQTANWENARLFRSWLVYDSGVQRRRRGINWHLLLGLSLAVVLSVAFWVGVAVLVWDLVK